MRTARFGLVLLLVVAGVIAVGGPAGATPVVFSGTGTSANTTVFPAFESGIGGSNNGGSPASQPAGFRSATWESVPGPITEPHAFDGSFYGLRGLSLSTPGDHLGVSTTGFSEVDASYPLDFAARSPTGMFAPVGSRVTEVRFVVPGSDVAATTSAFGAFFLDVDSVNATSMQFFSRSGASLGTYTVPSAPGNQGLSFLGAIFPGPDRIARVEITSGVAALAPGQKDNQADVVAMDDFVWAEPQPGNGCTINGTGGDDHLIGTGGNDVICGFDGKDSISGGGSNDTIVGGADKDSIVGGDGKDTIVGQTGNDTLKGGKGADLIESSNDAGGADTVDGGQGADRCIADQEDTVTNCP